MGIWDTWTGKKFALKQVRTDDYSFGICISGLYVYHDNRDKGGQRNSEDRYFFSILMPDCA